MTLCAGSQLNFPIIAGGEWRNSSSVVVENTNIAGTYTFTITNSSTSCSNSTNIQVTESDLPTIPFTPQNLNICAGETQELQTATNGRWTYNGNTVQNANAAGTYTFTITNPATQSGTYNLVATNQNNCSAEASINVTINNSVTHEFSETACDFYEWNGTTYTNSGDFVKTLTATNGCDSIVTLHLTINASPEVEIVQKGNILMANEGFDSYNLNTGETTSTITISQIGIYTVTVVEGSCANSAEIEVSTLPTDIEQMRNSGIAVFPNPNNGQFTLNIDGIFNNSMYQIIDAKGAVIKEAKIVSKEENVSISVAPGSYFVRVITDKQVFVETIVVQ